MNIIDAFVVTLGLDRTQYKKEMAAHLSESKSDKDQLKNDASEVDQASKKANEAQGKRDKERIKAQKDLKDGLDATKRQAIETFAVLVGANSLKDYIANTVQAASSTQRIAQAAGLSVQKLSTFSNMVKASGGNAQEAQASIAGLAASMELARTMGQLSPQLGGALGRIGSNITDDPVEVFKKFASWSQGKDRQLVNQVGGELGFDQWSIAEAAKGRKAVEADLDTAKKLGALSDAQAEKLKKLQGQWNRLAQAVTGDALDMLTSATPVMGSVIDWVDKVAEKFPVATKTVMALAVSLGVLKGAMLTSKLFSGGAAAEGAAAVGEGAGLAGIGDGILAALGGIVTAIGGAAVAIPAAIAGAIAYAVHPSGGDTGEDDRMKTRIKAWKTAKTGDRAAQIKQYWMSHGYSEQDASGMVAAMSAENDTLDPGRTNPISAGKSHAYGLGQWLKGRQDAFRAWSGKDIHGSTLTEQLDFMRYEMSQGQYKTNVHGLGAQGASYAMLSNYYRPGAGLRGDVARANAHLSKAMHVTVGTVVVNTRATDAGGVAKALKAELASQATTAMSNSGLD